MNATLGKEKLKGLPAITSSRRLTLNATFAAFEIANFKQACDNRAD